MGTRGSLDAPHLSSDVLRLFIGGVSPDGSARDLVEVFEIDTFGPWAVAPAVNLCHSWESKLVVLNDCMSDRSLEML